jgi:acyl phosphate:glycerol-3-phosphate acyltransferase
MIPWLALLTFAGSAIGGYFLGSIPFGLVLTRAAGLGDIRKIGSGNIGATNVLRTGNRPLAAATVLLDGGKAAVALLISRLIFHNEAAALVAGASAFIGHCWPVWLQFKGGKGVATFFGLMLAGLPFVGVFSGLTWLIVAFTFRFSSLAALAATAMAPIFAYVFHAGPWGVGISALVAVLIWWRHRSNIKALLAGEERKIGGDKARPA